MRIRTTKERATELKSDLEILASKGLDLSWFDLSNYPSSGSKPLSAGEWAAIVLDRARLKAALGRDEDSTRAALQAFDALKKQPLRSMDSGLKLAGRRNDHPANTPSVFFLRAGEAIALGYKALENRFAQDDSLDAAMQTLTGEPYIAVATIRVNLRATREQNRKDFNEWLSRLDELQSKLAPERRFDPDGKTLPEWVAFKYLPYFDLW